MANDKQTQAPRAIPRPATRGPRMTKNELQFADILSEQKKEMDTLPSFGDAFRRRNQELDELGTGGFTLA